MPSSTATSCSWANPGIGSSLLDPIGLESTGDDPTHALIWPSPRRGKSVRPRPDKSLATSALPLMPLDQQVAAGADSVTASALTAHEVMNQPYAWWRISRCMAYNPGQASRLSWRWALLWPHGSGAHHRYRDLCANQYTRAPGDSSAVNPCRPRQHGRASRSWLGWDLNRVVGRLDRA